MSQVEKAALLAKLAHQGQEYDGESYFIGHLNEVAYRVAFDNRSEPYMVAAAYLHDIVEDTEVTLEDLEMFGFEPRVIKVVELLTKPISGRGYTYIEYIRDVVASNKAAAIVKLADNGVNLDGKGKPQLKDRYRKSIAILEEALKD